MTLSGIIQLPDKVTSSPNPQSVPSLSLTRIVLVSPIPHVPACGRLFLTLVLSPSLASLAQMRHSLSIGPDTRFFVPPMFGVTVLGSSHGFDPKGSTSGYVLWVNRRGVMIDPPPHSSSILEKNQIHPSVIDAVIVTHCHAGKDASINGQGSAFALGSDLAAT